MRGTDDDQSIELRGGPERRRQRSQPSARRRDATCTGSDTFIISLRTGRSTCRNSYLVVFFPLLSIWIAVAIVELDLDLHHVN